MRTVKLTSARVVGVPDAVGGVQERQPHCGQPEPHGAGASAEKPGGAPSDPREAERGKQRQSYTQAKGRSRNRARG